MATLVLLKEKGLAAADIFRGTFNGPDNKPSDWDYLTKDWRWNNRLSFKVYEYTRPQDLPAPYQTQTKKNPQLFFVQATTVPVEYQGKLVLSLIQTWIIQSLAESIQIPIPISTSELPPALVGVSSPVSEVPVETSMPKPLPVEKEPVLPPIETKDLSLPGTIAGSGLIVAGLAVLGLVVGNLLANSDSSESEEDSSIYFLDEEGRKVVFSGVAWDYEIAPKKWFSFLLPKKDDSEQKKSVFSINEPSGILSPATDKDAAENYSDAEL